jgi:hypothetical protein
MDKIKPVSKLPKITMPKLPLHQLSNNYAYWRLYKPHSADERRKVVLKCGKKCFLIPESLKYPICPKDNCNIDCRGLTAAAKRAFLVANNPRVKEASKNTARRAYTKARALGIERCKWT